MERGVLGGFGICFPGAAISSRPLEFFFFFVPFRSCFSSPSLFFLFYFFFIFSPFPRKFFFKNLEKFFSRVGFCGATLYKSYPLGRRVEILPWVVGIRVGFWGLP